MFADFPKTNNRNMIPLSAAILFIHIIVCLLITSHEAHWRISNVVHTEEIPEDCSVCGIAVKHNGETARGRSFMENGYGYPWMVSFGWHPSDRHCLGTLIDAFHILTAAHCVIDEDGDVLDDYSVYFRNQPQADMQNDLYIDKIIVHPLYRLINSESTGIIIAKYDIALVKLRQRIKCDKYKNPICLPPADFQFRRGAKNIFSVWDLPGQFTKHRTDQLRHGFVRNLMFSECIKGVPETIWIKNHTLCQGGTQHRMCYGDSGSPLMKKINQKYYIVGILSSETNEDCRLSKPMIFMDVIKFLDWIEREKETSLLSVTDSGSEDGYEGKGFYGREEYSGGSGDYQGAENSEIFSSYHFLP